MQFTVIPYSRSSRVERDIAGGRQCFLVTDNWDDYSYKTAFSLIYLDGDGTRHDIGAVKIMQRNMRHGYTRSKTALPPSGRNMHHLDKAKNITKI